MGGGEKKSVCKGKPWFVPKKDAERLAKLAEDARIENARRESATCIDVVSWESNLRRLKRNPTVIAPPEAAKELRDVDQKSRIRKYMKWIKGWANAVKAKPVKVTVLAL